MRPQQSYNVHARAAAIRSYKAECAWLFSFALKKHGLPWGVPAPIVYDVEYRHHRGAPGYHPTDEDNAAAALKYAIDGMVIAGVVEKDTLEWVKRGEFTLLTTIEGCGTKGAGVTFIIRRRD